MSDTTDGDSASKRTLARRSFFRRKKHQRSSSRDSKDLSSFSSTQLSWFSDSGILGEDGTLASYQRVERLNCRCQVNWFFSPPRHQHRWFLILEKKNIPIRRCMQTSFDSWTVGWFGGRKIDNWFSSIVSTLFDDNNELYTRCDGERSAEQHICRLSATWQYLWMHHRSGDSRARR